MFPPSQVIFEYKNIFNCKMKLQFKMDIFTFHRFIEIVIENVTQYPRYSTETTDPPERFNKTTRQLTARFGAAGGRHRGAQTADATKRLPCRQKLIFTGPSERHTSTCSVCHVSPRITSRSARLSPLRSSL